MSTIGDSGDDARHRWSSARTAARGDQLLVLLALVAIWQACSLAFGTYWIGSPWGVLTRFTAGIFAGDLLRHTAYTLSEAVAGFLIGALPAAALPFCAAAPSDRQRDPRSVHGRRLRRAEARARAAVHPVVRHRDRIQDRARRHHGVLHRVFLARRPACARSTPGSCRWRRSSARANASSRATSCFPARFPTSSPDCASPCRIRSAAP